jgi:hypothetical protein
VSKSSRTGKRARADSDPGNNYLRELLQKKLAELNESATGKSEEIPAEELASVERLSRVVRLADELNAPSSRWPPVLALLVALLIVSLLMLIRVAETEVTLEAAVTEMSFTLPAEKPVMGRSGVAQLGVSGLDDLKISPEVIPGFSGARGNSRTIRLAVSSNAISGSALSTATLIPPSGTKVWFSHTGVPRGYRLSLKAPHQGTMVTLNAEAQGEVEIAAPGVLDKIGKFDLGKSGATFAFGSSNDIMDLDFVLNQNSDLPFYAQVPIEKLGLFRIEEFSTLGKSLVNPVSTLLSGTLYLESLNAEKRELRAGEQIRFNASKGRIESLKLESDRITFKFHGRVRGMKIGEEGVSKNLMPNLLEWLKARQPLSLVWGSTLFLYALIIGVLRWRNRTSRSD